MGLLTNRTRTKLLEQELQLLHSDKLQMKMMIHQVIWPDPQDHSLHYPLLLHPGPSIQTVPASQFEDRGSCLGKLERSLVSPEALSTPLQELGPQGAPLVPHLESTWEHGTCLPLVLGGMHHVPTCA